MQPLYRWREFDTLARGDRPHGDRARAAPDSLARTVSTLLRPSGAAVGAADVRARRVQRQRAQVDAGHARPRHAAGHLSGVSAFHHARGLGRHRIWRRLLEVLPERRGVLIIDGTSFPKQGLHSVGVGRQYCGALGKIANCQVAVTAALWTGARAWLSGALLYLPKAWITDADRRAVTQVPPGVIFQEKWRQALTLIRRARAAGVGGTGGVRGR